MLDRRAIQAIRARYEAQRHLFADLAHAAERFVANALARPQIRHMVASRAKSPDSLERKLWKRRERWTEEHFRDSLSPPLRDLAGARVLLYLPQDLGPTVESLVQGVGAFGRLWSAPVQFDERNRPNGYRAVHLHIARADGPLSGVPCEIQVCTLAAHLWNELEHDIVYKQHDECADAAQKELLFSLHGTLDLSETLAKRLTEHTARRILESEEPIAGPEELRRYLEAREGHRVLRGDFTALFELLDGLVRPVTPRTLHRRFEEGLSPDEARRVCLALDRQGVHQDAGELLARVIVTLQPEAIEAFVGERPCPPLWTFARDLASWLQGRGR